MAIYTNILNGGSNNHETTSTNANAYATDFFDEGVVGAITNTSGVSPATGSYAVNAQGSPDMTVAVTAGVAYVDGTPSGQSSQTFRVDSTAEETVTISANSTGSTKYDFVYISLDATAAANPNLAGDDVATLVVSRSTVSTSDDGTPPTYGYPLAVVTVANAASSITNGNIADSRALTSTIPDGSITNAKLNTTAGELGGEWVSYTPTISGTGTALGDGTVTGHYTRIGNTIFGKMEFTLGSSSTMGNPLQFTLPVEASTNSLTVSDNAVGDAYFADLSATDHIGVTRIETTLLARIVTLNTGGSYLQPAATSASIPFTWTTGDFVQTNFTYEAA